MSAEHPLAGRSVLVTRAQGAAAGELAGLLRARGADAIELPAIAIVDPPDWGPCDRAIEHLEDYEWLVFTSRNAVDRLLDRCERLGRPRLATFEGVVAAIGHMTATHLGDRGVPVICLPADAGRARAEGFLDAFDALAAGTSGYAGARMLLPRALIARETLPEGLRARGATVDVVPVYALVGDDASIAQAIRLLRERKVDAVCFASGATAEFFFGAAESSGAVANDLLDGVCVASIGPVTSDTLRRLGQEPAVEARERSMESLVQALEEHFAAHAGGDR
ncbi:MAG: uroporphyrinogen-III synthase [Candidatus Eiseniibacteriota bacterium]